jgi:phenylacetic acid degradation operon negative regulatory protein
VEDTEFPAGTPGVGQPRPQSLVLAFFGNHVLDEGGRCVYSGSIIDVLGRVGVGEQAVRSTLTRMVGRGLLRRQRQGRRMYFGPTAQAERILREGGRRIWHDGAVNEDWDGVWTLLGFSLPDSWQRQRHDLRSRLIWYGFGALYSGLWIAPGRVDVSGVIAELGLADRVKVFHASADEATTDVERMIRESWDLAAIAARYTAFDQRWTALEAAGGHLGDPVATRLLLVTEWLGIIRTDPRLPVRHLPPAWPARPAQETFRRIATRTHEPARRLARELLDTVAEAPDDGAQAMPDSAAEAADTVAGAADDGAP